MDILFFIGTVIIITAAVLGYAWKQIGSLSRLSEYLKTTEGKGVVGSYLLAILIIGALLIFMRVATAGWVELYAGADYTFKPSPQCEADNHVDNRITSNIGLRGLLYDYQRFSLIGNYTHHSCFIGVDDRGYDAVGVQAVYRVTW